MNDIANRHRPETLAIHWPRFGPYHLARLQATCNYMKPLEIRVVGLETAYKDGIYPWRQESGSAQFERYTAFPRNSYKSVSWIKVVKRLFKLLNTINPTAVAINGYSTVDSLAILSWCILNQRPAILMMESKRNDAPRQVWKEKIKRGMVSRFMSALCGGSLQRAYLEELGMPSKKIFLGYDAVDNDYFEQASHRVRQSPGAYRNLPGLETPGYFFLASARFIPRKNLDGLLLAYSRYRYQMRGLGLFPWRLVILGDGEERSSLEKMILDQEIEGTSLPGFRQIDELPAYYGLASVFIHPPLQEQWGLVVNEAMASGLPVLISERCGCVPDLIQEGLNSFCFNPQDLSTLVQLMLRCSTGEINLKDVGEAARQHIRDWGPERFAQGMYQALRVALC